MRRLKDVIVACVGTAVVVGVAMTVMNFGDRIDQVDGRLEQSVSDLDEKVGGIVSFLSTTTTSTSTTTTSTTTTTVAPAPVKPSRSALWLKVDEYYDGDLSGYTDAQILKAGNVACSMWNSVAGVSRTSVIREIRATGIDNAELAAHISQAVLWTICTRTATFPQGPLPVDNWR